MPWHQEPTKDVAICDKPRLAESRLTRGFPNGETRLIEDQATYTEYIGICGEPPELKHLSRARKRNQPRFRKQWRANAEEAKPGVEIFLGYGLQCGINKTQQKDMGRSTIESDSLVCEKLSQPRSILSTAGHVKPGGNTGGPPSKPKYYPVTDSVQYCEGKVKRTPGGE